MKKDRIARGLILCALMVLTIGMFATSSWAFLIAPANGSNVPGTTITFSWEKTSSRCELEVATDPNFDNVVLDYFAEYPINSVNVSGFGDDGQQYYWQITIWLPTGHGYPSVDGIWSFVNGPSGPPDPPSLSSPGNGSNVGGNTVQFRWGQANHGADNYHLQIAYDSNFTQLFYDAWIGNYSGADLGGFPNDGRQYYWRVQARNTAGDSNFSSAWTFINGTAPDTPSLSSPGNSSNVGGTTIAFRWNQAARANDYYVEVAYDSGFSNRIFDGWIGNTLGLNLSGFLDDGQQYYWRVKARNYQGESGFSDTWSFVNGTIPDTPSLSSPGNSSNVGGNNVQFRWNSAARANDYYLEVAYDTNFSNHIFSEWIGNYIGLDLNGYFANDGRQYYWRVKARNYQGESGFSDTWSFVNGTIPDTPSLSSPGNSSNVGGTTIAFRWNQAARANDYYIEVAYDVNFSNRVFNEWIGNYIGLELSGFLNDGRRYYWRVKARNYQGESGFSDTWSFVNGALPMITTIASPSEGGVTSGDGSYEWGATVTVSATANSGYGFEKWTENTSIVSTSSNYTFIVGGNRTLVANFNAFPILDPIGDQSVNENSNLSFTVSASDVDNNILFYSASNLPAGASFNKDTRTFSWTPTILQEGAYTNIEFEASDGSLSDSEQIDITVYSASMAPFTDDPLVITETDVKAVHIEELRKVVEELDSSFGLDEYTWTDLTLEPEVADIKAVHIEELRQAIEEIYVTLDWNIPIWNEIIEPGVTIKAEHVEELRQAIKNIYE